MKELHEAIMHEMYWVRQLRSHLSHLTMCQQRDVRKHVRAYARTAIDNIRCYREWIDYLDPEVGALSENQKRAMRAYAVRHGKSWRFKLRDEWKAGRIGGELKAFLDKWGAPMLAWCKLAYLDPFEPSPALEKLQKPLVFHHL